MRLHFFKDAFEICMSDDPALNGAWEGMFTLSTLIKGQLRMSEETKVEKILIQVKPNNDAQQLEAMLTEFEAHGLKLEGNGIISVPKLFTHITDKEELLFVFPNRQDFMVALEKDEYVILTQ